MDEFLKGLWESEDSHVNAHPSLPADYPWRVAPQHCSLPFYRPTKLSPVFWLLSRLLSLRCFPFYFTGLSGCGEFGRTDAKDRFGSAFEPVLGRYVADCTVQTPGIVMIREIGHDVPGVFTRQGRQ